MTEGSPSPGELAHYGVKGMKWGVKKARTGVIDKKLGRLDRVASGKGTFREKAVTAAGLSGKEIGLAKGSLKKAARNKSTDLKGQRERLATGKATAKDLMKAYGTVSLTDIARSTRD